MNVVVLRHIANSLLRCRVLAQNLISTMEKSTAQFSSMQLIFMITILLRQLADRLGVIISPVELLSEASGGGFISTEANDWSTLGSAMLASDERMNDPSIGPSRAAGGNAPTPASASSTLVPQPPPFPPPRRGGKGGHDRSTDDAEHATRDDSEDSDRDSGPPWKRHRK